MSDVDQLRMRCRNVGARYDVLAHCSVLEQKKGEANLANANFYALPPSNMRYRVDHQEWRRAWARACEESSNFPFFAFQNRAPLLIVTDANGKFGPPTANLKMCYQADSIMRARVILDLDCDQTFKSDELMDCASMHKVVCGVLQEHLHGVDFDISWEKEPCIFFYGSTLAKERTGHLVFTDLSFASTPDNAFKDARGKMVKKAIMDALDSALEPFGVNSDLSIATSGLRYEFTDKLEKDKTWRGGVSLPEFAHLHEVDGMEWSTMIILIDPLCLPSDCAFQRTVEWRAEVDENPRPLKKVAATPHVVVMGGYSDALNDVAKRVETAFPALKGKVFLKQHAWRQDCDLYLVSGKWCPLRNGDHSSAGKVKIVHRLTSDEIIVGCFPCEGKGVSSIKLSPPNRALVESEKKSILLDMNSKFAMAPMGSKGNNKLYVWTMPRRWDGDFRFQTPQEFLAGNTHMVHWYFPADSRKAKKITHARMWLDSRDRRTFPLGQICAPMGAPDGYFNTWRGFHPSIMNLAEEMRALTVSQLVDECQCFLKHFHVNVCGGDADLGTFLLSWFKFVLTELDKKSGVAVVLSGEPGCGKTYFFEAFLKIIGDHHSNVVHDSAAMSAQFSHEHSDQMRLEVFDEATTHNDARKRGIVNGLITSEKMRRERKYQNAETVTSFTNLIICSNYAHAVDAIKGERRFQFADVAFRLKDVSKKDFFDAAHKERENSRSLAAIYLLITRHFKTAFHPRNIVHNQPLWRNVFLGLPALQKWWFNCLRFGQMHVDKVRTIVRVTGNPDEDERANAAADKLVVQLWDQLGMGADVAFSALRTSILAYERRAVPSNTEIESLLKVGNVDPLAFHVKRIGSRSQQEPVISLPSLTQCRCNFAAFVQFPAKKIFQEWNHELK